MWLFSLCSSPRKVWSGGSSGELVGWNFSPKGNGEVESITVKAHENPIYSVFAKGELLFTGADEEIRVWKQIPVEVSSFSDCEVNQIAEMRIPQLQGSRGALSPVAETNGLATNSSGDKLMAAAGDGNAYVFDVGTEKLLNCLRGHQDYLHSIVVLDRTGLLATGSEDGTCKIWDLRQNQSCVATLNVGDMCCSLSLSSDENWIAIGGADRRRGVVTTCHVASRVITSSFVCAKNRCAQAVCYTDSCLVVGGDSNLIEYWNRTGNDHIVSIPSSSSSIYTLCYEKEFGFLSAAGSSNLIDIFSKERDQLMALCV